MSKLRYYLMLILCILLLPAPCAPIGGPGTNSGGTGGGSGAMTKDVYDADTNNKVDAERLDGAGGQDLYRRQTIHEFPMRFTEYAATVAAKGYSYMYPQAFTINNGYIYIVYGGVVTSNDGSWVAIYEWGGDYTYIGVYELGAKFGEGVVVKTEAGKDYLYTRTNSNTLSKFDVTNATLPASGSTLTAETDYTIPIYGMLAWDGTNFLVQLIYGPTSDRHVFGIYDSTFTRLGTVSLDPDYAWPLLANAQPYGLKLQGVTYHKGSIYGAYGTDMNPLDGAVTPDLLVGPRKYDPQGRLLASGLMDPNTYGALLTANGHTAAMMEMEGVTSYGGDLYALFILRSHVYTGAGGILITRELYGSLDCTSVASAYSPSINRNQYASGYDYHASGVTNPLTGVTFARVRDILDFMMNSGLKRYAFWTTGSTVAHCPGTDTFGGEVWTCSDSEANFGTGRSVEITTGSYASFLMSVNGANEHINYNLVYTPGTSLVETWDKVSVNGATPGATVEGVVLGVGAYGKIATCRTPTTEATHWEVYNGNGLVGHISAKDSGIRIFPTSSTSVLWASGAGSPEGAVTAAVGSLYTRTDGGANTTLYIKESGTGNTGWIAK